MIPITDAVMGLSWLHKMNFCLQFWEALSWLECKHMSIGPDPQMDFGVTMFNFFLVNSLSKILDSEWSPTNTQVLWAFQWPTQVQKNSGPPIEEPLKLGSEKYWGLGSLNSQGCTGFVRSHLLDEPSSETVQHVVRVVPFFFLLFCDCVLSIKHCRRKVSEILMQSQDCSYLYTAHWNINGVYNLKWIWYCK